MAALDANRTVNVAVQVLPMTAEAYAAVDRAIAVIRGSGVRHEVGPMQTVLEGPLDDLLEVAKRAHLACFEAGAARVVTIITIGDAVEGTSIDEKVAPYRGGDERDQ
jgi:uncharacterized protein (TIGR00106 family)